MSSVGRSWCRKGRKIERTFQGVTAYTQNSHQRNEAEKVGGGAGDETNSTNTNGLFDHKVLDARDRGRNDITVVSYGFSRVPTSFGHTNLVSNLFSPSPKKTRKRLTPRN